MINDISYLGSVFGQLANRFQHGCNMAQRRVLPLTMLLLAPLGCAEEDDGVTYAGEVFPLFYRRCTICHYSSNSPSGVDIQSPFSPDNGLVTSKNFWKEDFPDVDLPVNNVEVGDPDNSFLIHKISDPDLGLLPATNAGERMPLQIPPVTAEELASIEQWIVEGATETEQFRLEVVPILGNASNSFGYPDPKPGKCVHCHYEGTPNPPDLTNPFDRETGVVNVDALYRADMDRVTPGEPERSLLFLKVRLGPDAADASIGAPMPFSFEPLSDRSVDVVRQWIVEGARP